MSDEQGWAAMLAILVGMAAAIIVIGLGYVHDNSVKQIPYRQHIVDACSAPANWNVPVCVIALKNWR